MARSSCSVAERGGHQRPDSEPGAAAQLDEHHLTATATGALRRSSIVSGGMTRYCRVDRLSRTTGTLMGLIHVGDDADRRRDYTHLCLGAERGVNGKYGCCSYNGPLFVLSSGSRWPSSGLTPNPARPAGAGIRASPGRRPPRGRCAARVSFLAV